MAHKRDPEATRQSLLEAAECVFLEKGFGNTALSEIARRAGITKSLIHHYFGSKENLWQEVKQRRFDDYADEQMAMLQQAVDPTEDLLRNSMKLYFRFLKVNPEIVRILAWMFLERDSDICPMKHDALITAGVEQIRSGQAAGILRKDLDPRFVLFTFLGLSQHWFQDRQHFIHDFGTDGLPADLDDAYLSDMLELFLKGVLADNQSEN
jgi:TetR/AcrR family transcriptional regulator